jgi:hypothetical protein
MIVNVSLKMGLQLSGSTRDNINGHNMNKRSDKINFDLAKLNDVRNVLL